MKSLKTLVLWLLLLAIPLQGIAANAVLIAKAEHKRTSLHQHADDHHAMHASSDNAAGNDACQSVDGFCAAYCLSAPWIQHDGVKLPVIDNLPHRISYTAVHLPSVDPDTPEPRPRFPTI